MTLLIQFIMLALCACSAALAGAAPPQHSGAVMPEVDSSILALIGSGAAVGIVAVRRAIRKSK
jgi:hypothetical protein